MAGSKVDAVPGSCAICHATYTGRERFCPLDGGAIIAERADRTDPLIGKTIDGRYLVRRMLGRGGMGSVYEAEHVGLDRTVALKFITSADRDPEALARFRREARAASRVIDEHVVQIYDVGVDSDGHDYIAMEYVEGSDLRDVTGAGPIEPARAVRIACQILRGLHAIHEAGIVHRDIKPANIRLARRAGDDDFVKIMDFGISKATDATQGVTKTGLIVGTPQYMAPEQLAGEDVDRRADLYAVGLTLYAMISGNPPFSGDTMTQANAKYSGVAPRLERVPRTLADTVARSLAKQPSDRFATALDFIAALDGDAPAGATVRSRPQRMPPARRPARAAIVAGAIVVALVGTIAGWLVVHRGRTPAATVAASERRDAGIAPTPTPPPPPPPIPAVVSIDAGIPPDAAIAHAKLASAPTAPLPTTGEICRCIPDDQRHHYNDWLCQVEQSPLCYCATDNGGLCPQRFVLAVGDECDNDASGCYPTGDIHYRCAEHLYNYYHLRATPAAACSGYSTEDLASDTASASSAPERTGSYECSFCIAKRGELLVDTNRRKQYVGKTGDACSGFGDNAPERLPGHLKCGADQK